MLATLQRRPLLPGFLTEQQRGGSREKELFLSSLWKPNVRASQNMGHQQSQRMVLLPKECSPWTGHSSVLAAGLDHAFHYLESNPPGSKGFDFQKTL